MKLVTVGMFPSKAIVAATLLISITRAQDFSGSSNSKTVCAQIEKALSNASASKDDLSKLRAEVKKVYDGLNLGELITDLSKAMVLTCHLEFLSLRSHVWGLRE